MTTDYQTLSKSEIFDLFWSKALEHKHYKKQGSFLFRKAHRGETVLTIVNGKLETMKTAGEDEFVLRNIMLNSSAETYVISTETFAKRYQTTNEEYFIDGQVWGKAEAKGEVMAVKSDRDIRFQAPWGEDMYCQAGDYLANPLGGSRLDVYRIEKDTFNQTYGDPVS